MNIRGWMAAVAAAAVTVVGGCRTSSNTAEIYAVSGPDGQITIHNNITVNRPWLARRLEFGELRSRVKNGFLEADVEVTNKLSRTQNIEYSFVWFDEQGFSVDSASSPWTPQVIYGKQTVSLRAIAPTTAARKVRLQVRSGK